jgi:hypothetical protein
LYNIFLAKILPVIKFLSNGLSEIAFGDALKAMQGRIVDHHTLYLQAGQVKT